MRRSKRRLLDGAIICIVLRDKVPAPGWTWRWPVRLELWPQPGDPNPWNWKKAEAIPTPADIEQQPDESLSHYEYRMKRAMKRLEQIEVKG